MTSQIQNAYRVEPITCPPLHSAPLGHDGYNFALVGPRGIISRSWSKIGLLKQAKTFNEVYQAGYDRGFEDGLEFNRQILDQ